MKLEAAEGASFRPETLRPKNGRLRVIRKKKIHGGLWRAADRASAHRRGAVRLRARPISQVRGQRAAGVNRHAGHPRVLEELWVDAHRFSSFISNSAPASSTS